MKTRGLPVLATLDLPGWRSLVDLLRNGDSGQIARRVNAGIAGTGEAKRALYLLDQVYERMYQIAKR